jgi:ribonucleoside-triphosphate reductase
MNVDVMKPDMTTVFSFPMKRHRMVPSHVMKMTAIEQLELWKTYAIHWCEHKPSVSLLSRNTSGWKSGRGYMKTLMLHRAFRSFRFSDHTYQQAPYQDIEPDEYHDWMKTYEHVVIDWDKLTDFEKEDNTSGSRELACTAGVCEVVDLNAA